MNTIWFDMDGTIYDLYKVADWLPRLRAEDFTVYAEDMPRKHFERINNAIEALVDAGWRVGVITWAGKGYSWDDEQIAEIGLVKHRWLNQYFPALGNGCFACIPYGESKAEYLEQHIGRGLMNVLVDDNKEVRKEWRSHSTEFNAFKTINAARSFVRELESLIG